MANDKRHAEELLLDWHMDLLESEDRAWIDAELKHDAELRAKSDRLGRLLQPLDHWRVSRAPANLPDKVLDFVRRAGGVESRPLAFPAEAAFAVRRFPRLPRRDVIAAAACILLLIGVFIPGVSELRERSRRVMCASNLGMIFRGASAYQEAFAGSLPFAGNRLGSSWLPGGAAGQPFESNSRHAYLLVKLEFLPSPERFVCAAAGSRGPMRSADWTVCDDFASAGSITYATLNLAGPRPNLRPAMPIAYLSDANPLFVNAKFNDGVDPYYTNSPAHRGRGQNVLTVDGSATWMPKPVYGRNHDNLWLIDNIRRYEGTEAPDRDDDVQLVPGYPATDPSVRRALAE